MREEIIPLENIQVGVKAGTWQEAVQAEEIIACVNLYGPYMVLMPNFALAHAEPGPSVLKDDMSLILLDQPVEFGSENDPVSIVLCVGCVNRDSHREALTRIAEALMDDAIYDRLADARSAEEAYAILHEE